MAVNLLSTKPHRAAGREGVSQKAAVHADAPYADIPHFPQMGGQGAL